jgi:[ribosomal protein S18]-alanine N-acetyltransferase
MLVIRAMASADVDTVVKLAADTPEAPQWDNTAYERILSREEKEPTSRTAWLAFEGSDLLGFAVAHLVAGHCELESIVVAKCVRRTGIGKSLLGAVSDWALSQGSRKLELEVRAGNQSAVAFYECAGFIREGLRPGYYRDPDDDAVLMGKLLYSDD